MSPPVTAQVVAQIDRGATRGRRWEHGSRDQVCGAPLGRRPHHRLEQRVDLTKLAHRRGIAPYDNPGHADRKSHHEHNCGPTCANPSSTLIAIAIDLVSDVNGGCLNAAYPLTAARNRLWDARNRLWACGS